jgi:hypothetical protein
MRVISRDGTIDVPYEEVLITLGCSGDKRQYHINGHLIDQEGSSSVKIATYSTEEKAKKAMEELRYAYMCHSLVKMGQTPPDGIDEKLTMSLSGVFQFPAEEELE